MFKFNLGDSVKDTITGYTGVIVARTEWFNGCLRYVIQTQKLSKEGVPIADQSFDEQQLVLVKAKQVKIEKSHTGGPFPHQRL